jgi:serine/threonine protein kinase
MKNFEFQKFDFYVFLEARARQFFVQMVNTVQYCHKRNVFHRDLKLDNFILGNDNKIKVIDFGLSCTTDALTTEFVGSIDFGAPEILAQIPYNARKADVFSLGTVLYILLYGIMPFESEERHKFLQGHIIEHPKLEFPRHPRISQDAKDLLEGMITMEPDERMDLNEVIKHKWTAKKGIFRTVFRI